jgi:hypothetical protein
LELKGLLAKANLSNTKFQAYIAALEAEVAIWRSGGHVEESAWATSGKPAAPASSASAPAKKPPVSSTPSSTAASRSMTPVNPALESLKDLESRPQTPTVIGLDKDEREEFLRRENELSDTLAEKESALAAADKLVKELKEELAFLKEQEASANKVIHLTFSFLSISDPSIRITKSCHTNLMSCVFKWKDWAMTTKKASSRSTSSRSRIKISRTSWKKSENSLQTSRPIRRILPRRTRRSVSRRRWL